MECLRKMEAKSKNRTSKMSVIVKVGALAGGPAKFTHSLTSEVNDTSSPPCYGDSEDVSAKSEVGKNELNPMLKRKKRTASFSSSDIPNKKMRDGRKILEKKFDQKYLDLYRKVFNMEGFEDLLKTSSDLLKDKIYPNDSDSRQDVFMYHLGSIEDIWERLGITLDDIITYFDNAERVNILSEYRIRNVITATYEYMQEFLKLYPDTFSKKSFMNYSSSSRTGKKLREKWSGLDNTKMVRTYWIGKLVCQRGQIIIKERKLNPEWYSRSDELPVEDFPRWKEGDVE